MVNSKVHIRQIKSSQNIAEVLILNSLIFPEDDLDVRPNTFHWLARDKYNKEPVGFCSATDFGQRILFLSRAGLLSEYRGRGIQRRFIRVRENFASRYGFKAIITYTVKDNYTSMASLIKSGYKIYDPEYDYVGGNVTYFMKEL